MVAMYCCRGNRSDHADGADGAVSQTITRPLSLRDGPEDIQVNASASDLESL